VVRIASLFRKKQTQGILPPPGGGVRMTYGEWPVGKINYELLSEPEEKKLLLRLADYDAKLHQAWQDYNPAILARYTFELAKDFNDFYAKHQVLETSQKDLSLARLVLSLAVQQVLVSALEVLGIKTVEEM